MIARTAPLARHVLATATLCLPLLAAAQPQFDGFLCCNMRSDGKWISDINYAESGKHVIPAGTPIRVTGYGKQRVHVEVNGTAQALGNDYSRDLGLGQFAQRYVVTEDPREKLDRYPGRIREAIRSARVTPGMTREQVLMSVGYPVTSENPHLDARVWKMWLWTFSQFDLVFDGNRLVEVRTDPETRAKVVMQ